MRPRLERFFFDSRLVWHSRPRLCGPFTGEGAGATRFLPQPFVIFSSGYESFAHWIFTDISNLVIQLLSTAHHMVKRFVLPDSSRPLQGLVDGMRRRAFNSAKDFFETVNLDLIVWHSRLGLCGLVWHSRPRLWTWQGYKDEMHMVRHNHGDQ